MKRIEVAVHSVERKGLRDGYEIIRVVTSRGSVEARYYRAPGSEKAVIWFGGVGGGYDSPAKGLYEELSPTLAGDGISSLRVKYRHPTDLMESVADVLAAILFLEREGIKRIALVGHSLGGAVAISAGRMADSVTTVVTLASQNYGTELVESLAPRSILLIHGAKDSVLPPASSRDIFARASEPKRLIIHDNAGHGLDEASDEVRQEIREWVQANL